MGTTMDDIAPTHNIRSCNAPDTTEHTTIDISVKTHAYARAAELLREYFRQIAQVSFIHYIGGSYDPEHMRAISNAARRALNGEFDNDFEEHMQQHWKEYSDPYHVQELEADNQRYRKRIKKLKARLT